MVRLCLGVVFSVWALVASAATVPPVTNMDASPPEPARLTPLALEAASIPAPGCCTTGNMPIWTLQVQAAFLTVTLGLIVIPALRRPPMGTGRPP